MSRFEYTVIVDAADQDQANRVMAERLDHDEDYGFPYQVSWRHPAEGTDLPSYEMFTDGGNRACEELVAALERDVKDGKITRLTIAKEIVAGMRRIAASFPEVHDTEPETHIVHQVNLRICDPQGWKHLDRFEDL